MRATVTLYSSQLLILLITQNTLHAAGFAIKENSASLLGQAFSNASTWTQDISGMRTNPALIGQFNEQKEAVLGVSYVMPKIHLQNIESTPPGSGEEEPQKLDNLSNATHNVIIPDSFISMPINHNLVLGLAITSPWGLSTQYPAHWPGEYHAIKTDLKTYNVNPVVAYNYSSRLTVAAGLQVQLMQANLIQSSLDIPHRPGDTAQAHIRGDSIGLGASLGLFYLMNQDNQLGIGYQSNIMENIKGELNGENTPIPTSGSVETNITTPDILNIGLLHQINSQWSISTNLEWTHWDSFQSLIIHTDTQAGNHDIVLNENWHNTFYYALGTNYHYNSKLDLRAGLAYDESPVPDSTRSPRTPDNNRLWTSVGVGYQFSDSLHFDLGYTHIFMQDSTIDLNTDNDDGALFALNHTNADILSSALAWTF